MRTANSPTSTTESRASAEQRSWTEILQDYGLAPYVMADDGEEMLRIKGALSRLSEPDRRIIVLYAELGNIRGLARRLGVSRSTAHNRVKRIQALIKADVLRYTLAEEVARL